MKKKFLLLFLILGILSFTYKVNALTKYEVSTVTEYFNAIEEISNSSNGEYVIELKDDITVTAASEVKNNNTINNGNTVTIIGNGHSFKCAIGENCRLKVSNATLNLGKSDGSDTLIIEGNGDGTPTYESLVSVGNGVVNMYDGVTLQNNKSGQTSLVGGAVDINSNGTFNMEGGIIQNNSSESSGVGGAIAVDDSNARFVMNGGTITGNTSVAWGGAIYISNGDAILNKGTISNNEAPYGGAVAITGGNLEVYDVNFSNNSGSYSGAILGYNEGDEPSLSIDGAVFMNNAGGYGGAVMNYGVDSLTIENSYFEGNTATYGGAIINYSGSTSTQNNVYISNNAQAGGAIYSQSPFTSVNDVIKGNTATASGGGVYLRKTTADFSTTDVYNNKATTSSNDYYISNAMTAVSIKDASMINGYATYDGTNVNIKNYFTDASSNRYSLDNVTDAVLYSDVTAGTTYNLTASGDAIYVVTFNTNGGSTIDDGLVEIGDKVIRPTDPTKSGYDFVNWYSDPELENEFNFDTTITSNITLYAKWAVGSYNVIDGDEQKYEINKGTDISFTIDAAYNLFENGGKVYIDDSLLDAANYTASEDGNGNTVITLKSSYLNTLSVKDHSLKVEFNNGGKANGTFTIVDNSGEGGDPSGNPKTGDKVYAYVGLLLLSVFGLVLSKIFKKVYNI